MPCPPAVARGVVDGHGLDAALASLGLTAGRGWPHRDTADAVRPVTEHRVDGSFLITVDGQVVGECGWLGGPDDEGDAEIGYGLAGPSRGRGLGTEAVAVLSAWVERQPGVRRVTASVLIGNEPSYRLLTRLGFRAEPATPPYARYVRDAPAWTGERDSG